MFVMRPINVAISFSTPDYRTVTTLIQAICPFLLFLANFMFIWCIYYIHVLPILCFYTHTVKINFSVHLLLIIKKEKNSKINNDDYHQFFSFFFSFSFCSICAMLVFFFLFYLYLCVILHLSIIDQNNNNNKKQTNRVDGCVVLLFIFFKTKNNKSFEKKWRRIIGKWIKIYLILFCFSCYYHSFAYILPILGMI